MNYYECTFSYTQTAAPLIEAETVYDVLAAELGEVGFESFSLTEGGLQGYVSERLYDPSLVAERLQAFPLAGIHFHSTSCLVEDKDWNEVWEKNYFQPIHIGSECLIHASFHQVDAAGYRYAIVIDPKMAFGTGNHETTRLMIDAILRMEVAGLDVLDMGCGTGVLAILAAMKGAARITAIDIDEWACRNTIENIALNHVPHIEVLGGGAERIPSGRAYDCIFANINRNILLGDIRYYAAALKPGGVLLLSGFYTDDIPALTAECRLKGLALLDSTALSPWAAMKTIKQMIV
jgi:ribosomal protein L11 methyltransferase